MAVSRFYLTADPAAVSPAAQWAGWNDSTGMIRGALAATPAGTNTAVTVAETNVAADWDVALGQWISEPAIRPGTLSGAASLTVARSESSTSADLNVIYVFSVVSGDGTVTRGTAAWTSSTEWPTTLTAATESVTNLAGADAADTIEVQAGDRLVLEYGYRTKNTVTTSFSGTARYGGTDSTDLANGDTGANATARPAWVEFADEGVADLFADVGTPFMVDSLGADARLAVEVAFGADLAADSATWEWTDVTGDVQQAGGAKINIRRGRSDEASTSQPSQCTVQLDNRAGAYSLGWQSANYPNVRRGTPVRVRVDPDLSGWRTRFFGYADGWTPGWDVTGRNAVVRLSASGTLRRLGQGAAPVLSALRRATLEDTANVVAYWPCEDTGDVVTEFVSGLPDGEPLVVTGDVRPGQGADFACSLPLPKSNGSSWVATVPTYTTTGETQIRAIVDVPSSGGDAGSPLLTLNTTGTAATFRVIYTTGGGLNFTAVASDGTTILADQTIAFGVDGQRGQVGLQLTETGGNINWEVDFLELGAAASVGFDATINGRTVGRVTTVHVNEVGNNDFTYGHVTLQSALTLESENIAGLNAHDGNTTTGSVTGRLQRLCAENGLTLLAGGDGTNLDNTLDRLGPQRPETLLTLLREIEATDVGLLLDGESAEHIGYRTRRYFDARATDLTVAATQLAFPFDPVDDDQNTRNRVDVRNLAGGRFVGEDTDGPLGTATIGAYETSHAVNMSTDAGLEQVAAWLVHLGTVVGYRYPRLALNLARNPELALDWAALRVGERITVTGVDTVRTQHPAGDLDLLVQGWSESLSRFTWDVEVNCSPYDPHRIITLAADSGDTGEFVCHLDTSGSTLATGVAAGATSLSVTTTTGPIWTTTADDFPFEVSVGGVPVTVTAISGASSPQTFTVAAVPAALTAGDEIKVHRPTVLGL